MRTHFCFGLVAALIAGPLAGGCGDDDAISPDAGAMGDSGGGDSGGGDDGGTETDGGPGGPPTAYVFESRFVEGESSVNHGGQTARQVLLQDLVAEMKAISAGVIDGTFDSGMLEQIDGEGEVVARLNAFVRAGSADLGTRPLPSLLDADDTLCESTYEDLGGANLIDKMAGEDDATDHMDWDGDDAEGATPAFVGWSDATGLTVPADGTIATPVGLLDTLFATFEAQVIACVMNVDECPKSPGGDPLPLYVTPEGHDLAQLVEKFLFGAVNYSQVTDDYLDDEADHTGKGLLVDNTMPRGDGAADTALEHHWDEGFGYFGAAADYVDYTDEEIAGAGGRAEYAKGYHDLDGDECIDLGREFNFDLAGYAAKRDLGSTSPTDLTSDIFGAFVRGRHLISQGADLSEIQAQRDEVVAGFDRLMAANTIHYINSTLSDLGDCDTTDFDFEGLAAHWSEMKAFALGLQFNPRSAVHGSGFDFAAMLGAMGDAPVQCTGDVGAYETALLGVRADLQAAYGFAASDVENW